ncbi:uncharacterized protein SCHCODRAFT_02624947, partial [Schizophyllum commune H4-8]|uniref:uncharacterized protein n=1 Tax=Schizophyllum commune (strain H4-8 / FGSC 9210) TaxID=578458 RepID=UPI00215F1A6B
MTWPLLQRFRYILQEATGERQYEKDESHYRKPLPTLRLYVVIYCVLAQSLTLRSEEQARRKSVRCACACRLESALYVCDAYQIICTRGFSVNDREEIVRL